MDAGGRDAAVAAPPYGPGVVPSHGARALCGTRGARRPIVPGDGARDDAEEDKDFWRNMVHIQVHRRGRALGRLRKALQGPPEGGRMGAGSVAGVLLPLAV